MSINEEVREVCLFIFLSHTTHWRRGRQAEGSVYGDQQTGAIESKPTVKIQSSSVDPGIATVTSVLQVPMSDNVHTDSGGVRASVSMVSAGSHVSADEEYKEEDEESGRIGTC